MSKRTIELMNKANEDVGFTGNVEEMAKVQKLMDKFAELMIVEFTEAVKETAHLVAQTAYNDGESMADVAKRTNGALRVLEVMRKRLGVEE